MIIEIIDREFAESEALQTALVRTLWHQNVKKVDIFISPRVPEDAPEHVSTFIGELVERGLAGQEVKG